MAWTIKDQAAIGDTRPGSLMVAAHDERLLVPPRGRPEVLGAPDMAGCQDLAHAFDLTSAALTARVTLEGAMERRETRGCHNRRDHPGLDSALQVNLAWSPTAGITRESTPAIPDEISSLVQAISTEGKLAE